MGNGFYMTVKVSAVRESPSARAKGTYTKLYVADEAHTRGMTQEKLNGLFRLGPYGLEPIRPWSLGGILGAVPIGRVIQWYSAAQVMENDGQDGRRFWITIGNDVYDITGLIILVAVEPLDTGADKEVDLAFGHGETRLRDALRSCPGGNPMHNLRISGVNISTETLRARLAAVRCGMIKRAVPNRPVDDQIFIGRDLWRHRYPQTGMYTIIQGDVYTLSGRSD